MLAILAIDKNTFRHPQSNASLLSPFLFLVFEVVGQTRYLSRNTGRVPHNASFQGLIQTLTNI